MCSGQLVAIKNYGKIAKLLILMFSGNFMERSVEIVSKTTLKVWLEAATCHTEKGNYHKTIHAPKLLALLNVARIGQASPDCVHRRCWRSHRLFTTLTAIMGVSTYNPAKSKKILSDRDSPLTSSYHRILWNFRA
ncbi:hypothetical protein [uncultured Nostoc sp.]|uniref:hypothetical protein n=1 Tax=uncultured Nostoc sp. TaxID=340711 RepID=UPI0035CB018C